MGYNFAEIYLGHTAHGEYDPMELAKREYVYGNIDLEQLEELGDLIIKHKGLVDTTCPRCGEVSPNGLRVNDSMAALRCECGFTGYVDGA